MNSRRMVIFSVVLVAAAVLAAGYISRTGAQDQPTTRPGCPMMQQGGMPPMAMKGGGCPMMANGSCPMMMRQGGTRIPLIGEPAPAFEALTTQGRIKFPEDYKGKWVILFSHPADFTPVCTTEFMTFASMQKEFDALNCKLIGLSIDSNYSHIAWLRTIR